MVTNGGKSSSLRGSWLLGGGSSEGSSPGGLTTLSCDPASWGLRKGFPEEAEDVLEELEASGGKSSLFNLWAVVSRIFQGEEGSGTGVVGVNSTVTDPRGRLFLLVPPLI